MLKKLVIFALISFPHQGFAESQYISGKVVNTDGDPEAGVWVIAETADLPTEYRKIVVTDDAGQFVLPEMPKATYAVWVRGYGLADSDQVEAKAGDENLTLTARRASSKAEAASIYPSSYWLSMLEPPAEEALKQSGYDYTQASWLGQLKLDCIVCHQLGSSRTRFPSRELYDHGLKRAGTMNAMADVELGREVLLDALGSWGKRIAAGQTPDAPQRPQGVERNFVITQWGWGDGYTYSHDAISTDKRNPFLYPNEPVYGIDMGNDYVLKVDPLKHTASRIKIPTADWGWDSPWSENTYKPLGSDELLPFGNESLGAPAPGGASAHEGAYNNASNVHNPMLDDTGKVWLTIQIRREWGEDLPEFCQDDPVLADNPHHRQLGYYDTKTGEMVPIDTCFSSHHLQFDENDLLWTSGDTHVVGWLDTKKYDPSKPETLEAALGWSEVKVDSDGDGKGDKPINGFYYGVIPNPINDSVWTGVPPGMLMSEPNHPGHLLRFDRETNTHEAYIPPEPGYGPRGVDVDSKGVIWTALAGSGHLARFDRSRCEQVWGIGHQCPEGWTLWETPGPEFAGVEGDEKTGADMHYYLWVDQFDVLGMGKDTVIVNGTSSDSLLAFDPGTEEFTIIRIPYPLNSYTRGLDGRIDDIDTGWKGRGLWFTNGSDPISHSELPKSYLGKVQLRPSPTAR